MMKLIDPYASKKSKTEDIKEVSRWRKYFSLVFTVLGIASIGLGIFFMGESIGFFILIAASMLFLLSIILRNGPSSDGKAHLNEYPILFSSPHDGSSKGSKDESDKSYNAEG